MLSDRAYYTVYWFATGTQFGVILPYNKKWVRLHNLLSDFYNKVF